MGNLIFLIWCGKGKHELFQQEVGSPNEQNVYLLFVSTVPPFVLFYLVYFFLVSTVDLLLCHPHIPGHFHQAITFIDHLITHIINVIDTPLYVSHYPLGQPLVSLYDSHHLPCQPPVGLRVNHHPLCHPPTTSTSFSSSSSSLIIFHFLTHLSLT